MTEPESTKLNSGQTIRRLVTGLWQMADQERDGKAFDLDAAAAALVDYARAGFDTFDMADHYGSAEIVAGMAHKALREAGHTPPVIMTKWCPAPAEMDAATVRQGIETALKRLDLPKVDVMQFHWWVYHDARYLDALRHLDDLRREGLIGAIGLTNFDAAHLDLIARSGIEIATNQVSFSLLDRRAAGALSDVCARHGVKLLAYGTLCGGFLSDRFAGLEDPGPPEDWSRMKYRRFIDTAGGWAAFQRLMSTLKSLAEKHGVSVSNIASRWVLDHPAVAATIIGARLGENEHRSDNLRALSVRFDDDDRAALADTLATLSPMPGDCGDEYRKPPFLTASGDLSHHLDTLPPVFSTAPLPARPERTGANSGTVWEEVAGFSRAVRVGDRILVSGTTATDTEGNCVCPGEPAAQAVFVLDRIIAAVTSLGGAPEDIVFLRIYMQDAGKWEGASHVLKRYFGQILPATTLIGAAGLVGPYEIEIEAEAIAQEQG